LTLETTVWAITTRGFARDETNAVAATAGLQRQRLSDECWMTEPALALFEFRGDHASSFVLCPRIGMHPDEFGPE